MTESSADTASLCPHCLRRIPAFRKTHNDGVYLERTCPEHGALEKVLLWRNDLKSYDAWSRNRAQAGTEAAAPSDAIPLRSRAECPAQCGICPGHRQHTCSAILEVTRACDLRCPVCFAASETDSGNPPDIRLLETMLHTILDSAGACPIQLSGGEPGLRVDLPQIVALARKLGFDHIQINTNGLRLARDPDFGNALKDAGVTDFFLQFDGVTNGVYRAIRGSPLLQPKLRAIERCQELKIGVILVPTLVRNVNDSQIGDIIQFAKQRMPAVKGVHFQPMTYLGRYPRPPRNEDRILIPDILAAIEEQTGGELRSENFVPPG